MSTNHPKHLERARRFLTIPDFLHNVLPLGATETCDLTGAAATQCFNLTTGTWAFDLLKSANVPTSIFPEVTSPGSVLAELAGHKKTKVVAAVSNAAAAALAA